MTRDELKTQASKRFRDTGMVIVTATEWDDFLNQALGAFAADVPWLFSHERTFTQDMEAGDNILDLQAGETEYLTFTSIFNRTSGWPLAQLTLDSEINELYPSYYDSATRGAPMHYRVFGTSAHIFPVPDATYTLEVFGSKSQPVFSGGSDVPPFPTAFHGALVSWALARATLDDQDFERSQGYDNEYRAFVASARASIPRERGQGWQPVVDTFERDW